MFPILILLALQFPLFADEEYTFDDLMIRLIESPLLYVMSIEDTLLVTPEQYKQVVGANLYQQKMGKDLMIMEYLLDPEAAKQYNLAEEYFAKEDYTKAIKHYKAALKRHPTNAMVQTFLGQAYRNIGDMKAAKKCYLKAIKANYHGYMAHWFLANIYMSEGNIMQAVEEISLAKVLNRNNPRLQEHFETIMDGAGRRSRDYYFTPQVLISKPEGDSIMIRSTMEWLPYGIVEALWLYEPDFHEKERALKDYFNFTRAAEIFVSLNRAYGTLDQEYRQDPMLAFLHGAAKENLPRGFVLYEMLLPQAPAGVFQLPRNDIQEMQEYLLKVKHIRY
ncbi:MAG: tetratricopeptide repeat protein [Candidatus Cloacimonadaceae bacterium]|nr:tetratricopeptide repeat protein [Candidatus Cloacimonadaceae bacterium]